MMSRGGMMKAIGVSFAISTILLCMMALVLPVHALPPGSYFYVAHNPIEIEGNGGFISSAGVNDGAGTPDDPFIISTWNIVPSSTMGIGTAIRISNTTAHVLIEYVHVQDGRYGFLLENASNVTIMDCWISENEFGVDLEHCVSCKIMNSSLTDNQRAIREFECSNLVIWNNIFERNAADMIHATSDFIAGWALVLAASLTVAIFALIYAMRTSFSARRKPQYRIVTRLAACALIQLAGFYLVGPYLGRAFGNGAMSWDAYVVWSGVTLLLAIVGTLFVLIFKAKWTEVKLP